MNSKQFDQENHFFPTPFGHRHTDMAEKLKEKSQESRERLEEIKAEANQLLTKFNIQLDFNVDNDLGSLVVEVRNQESGEIVRKVPPENMIRFARHMQESTGLLLDKWS